MDDAPPATEADSGLAVETLAGLLSLLTHDSRNLLTAVDTDLAWVQRSIEAVPGLAEQAGALACVVDSTRQLAHYLRNLDAVAGVLAAQAPPRLAECSLGAALDSALHDAAALERSYGATLRLEVDPLARSVWADCPTDRLALLVYNLLANAIQNAPSDGRVGLSLQLEGERALFHVDDDGAPPSEAERAGFFRPPQQLRAKHGGARYGRGLGLVAAALAAERCGATLSSEARGAGHRFVLALSVRWEPRSR
jgi:signal transduction histidine kinase